MKVSEFAVFVAYGEKGKKETSIAQIKEILKVANELLDGKLYKIIRQEELL